MPHPKGQRYPNVVIVNPRNGILEERRKKVANIVLRCQQNVFYPILLANKKISKNR